MNVLIFLSLPAINWQLSTPLPKTQTGWRVQLKPMLLLGWMTMMFISMAGLCQQVARGDFERVYLTRDKSYTVVSRRV